MNIFFNKIYEISMVCFNNIFIIKNRGTSKIGNINTSNKTGRIAGVVWMDENKDGIKDASETKVSETSTTYNSINFRF